MRAVVLDNIRNIKLKEIKSPEISADEALLKVKVCSICGTDRKIYYNGRNKITKEQILGHEIAGDLVKTGQNVKFYKEGMRVTIAPNIGCGYCYLCRQGLEQLCPDFKAFGIGIPGGFAEYLKIPADVLRRGNVVEIPSDLSYSEAALIEPLACCYNSYESMKIKAGENLLIFGSGVMGNLNLLLNKVLNTGMITMVDIKQNKLNISKSFGADYVINSSEENLIKKVAEITNNKGFNNIITTVPIKEVQNQALKLAAISGKINFFAGLSGGDEVTINTNSLHYKQQSITGTTGSNVSQFRNTLKIVINNDIPIDKMVTKTIDLREVPEIISDDSIFQENIKIQVAF